MNGALISTQIGSFSLDNIQSRAKSVREKKSKGLNSSSLSGGTGEGQESPEKKSSKKHHITFMDDITGDKSKIV